MQEETILRVVSERGPMSVRRIRQLTHFSRRMINGVLHGSNKTAKTYMSPMSHRSKRPMWAISETGPIRPVHLRHRMSSRNRMKNELTRRVGDETSDEVE
jgi:hypothetical protein